MVRRRLLALEGVEAFARSEVAAIVRAGGLAAGAMQGPPIKNRRRDGEGSTGAGSIVLMTFSLLWLRWLCILRVLRSGIRGNQTRAPPRPALRRSSSWPPRPRGSTHRSLRTRPGPAALPPRDDPPHPHTWPRPRR